jgi:serine/threonine protein kinase
MARDFSSHPLCRSLVSLDEYTFQDTIMNNGSFGTVYAGRHNSSPPDSWNLVLKVVCPTASAFVETNAPGAKKARHRTLNTLREITLQYGCCHPCLLRIRGWNVLLTPYRDDIRIISERIKGNTVEHALRRLTPSGRRIVIYGTALGVQYLHKHSIMHRDIKPDNILLNSIGYPLLHDFGFAKVCQSATQSGAGGSQNYRSPEMGEDGVSYSFPSDIYSLAITFAAVLNGKEWVHNLSSRAFNRMVTNENFRPPFKVSVTQPQRDLIEAMWVKDLGQRILIDEVLMRLRTEGMWPRETDDEFKEFVDWLEKQPQEQFAMENKQQCDNASELLRSLEEDQSSGGGGDLQSLKDHLAECIGFMTGTGAVINQEMKDRVRDHLSSHGSLNPAVFAGGGV